MANALSRVSEPSDRVAPVRELFTHVAQMREFYTALVVSGKIHDVLELAQEHFARGIERRLVELPRARAIVSASRIPIAQIG